MIDTVGIAYSALVRAQARCNDLYESGAPASDILAAQGELKTARDEWKRVAGYTCAKQMHAECPGCDCICHVAGYTCECQMHAKCSDCDCICHKTEGGDA